MAFDQQKRIMSLVDILRPFFFEKTKDVTLASGKNFYIDETTTYLPSGVIVMWSGAISAIPTGWVICDGTNSTPNLTDRFVIHADADAAGTNNVGDSGGASTVDVQHSHTADGTLATDSDGHSHTADGTLATDTDGHDHTINAGATGITAHSHGPGTLATGTATNATEVVVDVGTGTNVVTVTHGHDVTQNATESVGHSHTSGTLDSDTDTHSHDVTGSTDTDTHSHDVTGSTADSLSTTQTIRDKYYALAYIMKS